VEVNPLLGRAIVTPVAVTDALRVKRVVTLVKVAMLLKFSNPVPAFIAALAPLKVTVVPVPGLKVPLLSQNPATMIPNVVVVRVPLFVILLQVAPVALTVTVIPLLIITLSFAPGTTLPPQVAVAFQLPVTDAVLVAA
jgi:hypothetical protein